MSNVIWETFGYIVVIAAVVLALWEWFQYRNPERDTWLVTRRRLRRRFMVSFVLVMIGLLIILEASGILDIHRVTTLLIYLFTMTGLALFLLLLAIVDASETMRNATRHAMDELNQTLEEEKRRSASPDDEPIAPQ